MVRLRGSLYLFFSVIGHVYAAGVFIALAHDHKVMRSERGWWCLNEIHIRRNFTAGVLEMAKLVTVSLKCNSFNPDANGTDKSVHISEVSLFACKNCSWGKKRCPHWRDVLISGVSLDRCPCY